MLCKASIKQSQKKMKKTKSIKNRKLKIFFLKLQILYSAFPTDLCEANQDDRIKMTE